jgi:hypothetical protein
MQAKGICTSTKVNLTWFRYAPFAGPGERDELQCIFFSCWKHMGIPILNAEQELSLDTCVLSPGAMFRDYGRQFLYCEVLSVDPSHIVFTCVLSGNVLY